MKVFMDDERDPPTGTDNYGRPCLLFDVVCRHSHEAIKLLDEGKVTFISLDHFMHSGEMTGLDVANHILAGARAGSIPKLEWEVHTQSTDFFRKIWKTMNEADLVWSEHKRLESERYC